MLATLVLGGLAAMTSCKKDWVCSCDGAFGGVSYTGADTTFTDMKKDEAETKCNSYDYSFGTDNYQDCELQ